MNELKLMAMRAKSRLLNKGLRDVYSNAFDMKNEIVKEKKTIIPSIELVNETSRKKQILNMIKNKLN